MSASVPKTVLVTGGARGIGAAIALELRSRGWKVIAPPRQELDLASAASVEAYLAGESPVVDALVNNAGVNPISPLATLSPDTWSLAQQVNLASPLRLIQHCAAGMRARGGGRIVNISSCYSFVTRPGRAAYSAAKAGLNSLTRSAALEFAAENILVNAVCPGFVETELTARNNTPAQIRQLLQGVPLGRLGRPEEIAKCVAFLLSDDNTYLTGQTIVVDGGFLIQ